MNSETEWIYCPVYENKTRDRVSKVKITVIREPDAEPMNLWDTSQFVGSVSHSAIFYNSDFMLYDRM